MGKRESKLGLGARLPIASRQIADYMGLIHILVLAKE
jgi:hypothetical protein